MAVHHEELKTKLIAFRQDNEKQAMKANQEVMEKYQ